MTGSKLLRDPFVHFLAAGTVLFAASTWANRGPPEDAPSAARVVRVSASDVAWLKQAWVRQWQRPPSDAELGGLVVDFLREELLAREARELGLDENDMIVRRRLAQKMTFLLEDTAHAAEPPEAEARALYQGSHERFLSPARISFTQLHFRPDRRGSAAASDAARAVDELTRAGVRGEAAELGDRSMLARQLDGVDQPAVASVFGPDFARTVFTLEPGRWHGPIASGYGLHVVWVAELEKERLPTFEEVRPQVIDAWRREQERVREERYFAALFRKYAVVADPRIEPLLEPLLVATRHPR